MLSRLTGLSGRLVTRLVPGGLAIAVALSQTAAWAQVGAQRPDPTGISVPYLVGTRADQPAEPRPVLRSQRLGLDLSAELTPIVLDPVDVGALAAEDAVAPRSPMRVGVSLPLGVALTDSAARFREVSTGATVWSVAVVSPGAQGLRLSLSDVDLPAGAELWLYAPDAPEAAEGPYQGTGPLGTGQFWSPIFMGDEVCVEYFLPGGVGDPGFFLIDQVSHLYRGLEPPEPFDGKGLRDAGPCHNDVMCFPAWHPLHNATARIYFEDGGGGYMCSGTLLTTVAGDGTPYFMTANHCVSDDSVAATVTAYWFFQTDSCDGPNGNYSQSGNTDVLYTSVSYDISLLMFNGKLPAGVTWAGWDTDTLAVGTDVACISHPAGDRKKITFGYKSGNTTTKFVLTWTSGTIEGGSSGSGLYRESTQSYIGVASSCAIPTDCDNPDGPCWYGKFRGIYSAIEDYLAEGSDDAFEDNDSCAEASPLSAGSYPNLVVKHIDDDWYSIVLEHCEELNLTMSHRRAWGDIDVQLFDACGGNLLAEDLGDDHNDKILTYLNEGATQTCYLYVFMGDGDSDTRNEYDLDVGVAPLDIPSVPVDVFATDGDLCGQVLVMWGGDPSATNFSIWRSETDDTGTAIEVGSTADTYFADQTVENEVIYYYWVKAHNGESFCGASDFSASDSGYSHCEIECPGDLDGDNDIDLSDLAQLLGNYGMTSGASYGDGDLDGDGDVDLSDLAALLGVYGTTCP